MEEPFKLDFSNWNPDPAPGGTWVDVTYMDTATIPLLTEFTYSITLGASGYEVLWALPSQQ